MKRLLLLPLLLLTACEKEAPPSKAPGLSPDGIGIVRIGETLEGLKSTLGPQLKLPEGADPQGCFYATADAVPGLLLMIENGSLQRIDVREGTVASITGIVIGDPAEKVQQTYGDKVDVQPHKYDYEKGAQYLTVFTDNNHAIRFTTQDGKIASFQAGNAEQVQYVEGCS